VKRENWATNPRDEMHKAVLRYICLAAQGTDTKATCPVIKTK
jgi:hypothetical protein